MVAFCKRLKEPVITLCSALLLFVCISGRAQTRITKEQAKEIVYSQILGEAKNWVIVYVSKNPVIKNTKVETWKSRGLGLSRYSVSSPYEKSWLFFIDDCPPANWDHPCRYVFVDSKSGVYTVFHRESPPADMTLFEKLWESGKRIGKAPLSPIPQTYRPLLKASSVESDPTKYAVLINGG